MTSVDNVSGVFIYIKWSDCVIDWLLYGWQWLIEHTITVYSSGVRTFLMTLALFFLLQGKVFSTYLTFRTFQIIINLILFCWTAVLLIVCACRCVYVYVCVRVCVRTCVRAYVRACVCACVCVSMYVRGCVWVQGQSKQCTAKLNSARSN